MLKRAVSLASALAVLALTPAVAQALPKVLTQQRVAWKVRPNTISYTGDGTAIIGGAGGVSARYPGRLRWTTYTARQGVARGTVWLDDCNPDCATGTFRPAPVTVNVFGPKAGLFRYMTLKFADPTTGRPRVDRRVARYQPEVDGSEGSWVYEILSRSSPSTAHPG